MFLIKFSQLTAHCWDLDALPPSTGINASGLNTAKVYHFWPIVPTSCWLLPSSAHLGLRKVVPHSCLRRHTGCDLSATPVLKREILQQKNADRIWPLKGFLWASSAAINYYFSIFKQDDHCSAYLYHPVKGACELCVSVCRRRMSELRFGWRMRETMLRAYGLDFRPKFIAKAHTPKSGGAK